VAKVVDRAGTTGACLKAVRELRGLSLAELSTTTRISQRFLDALERDSYADLPAATFVRGYVKMVVRALQITGTGPELEQFIDGYMARFHRNRG
jgi:cytoskeletal protein RodZ